MHTKLFLEEDILSKKITTADDSESVTFRPTYWRNELLLATRP
jgi:hypothetical protein